MIRKLWARLVDRRRRPAPDLPAAPPLLPLPEILGPFRLQPADTVRDRSDLLAAYASSRENDPELARRHPDSRQSVVEHEFESRQQFYPVDFPEVRYFLLSLNGAQAGRCYLQASRGEIFLVDLVLLPLWRNHGHGTALLRDLIRFAHASHRRLRLHVAKNNPRAAHLYERLGFTRVAELPHHWLLESVPESLAAPHPIPPPP